MDLVHYLVVRTRLNWCQVTVGLVDADPLAAPS